MTKTRAARARMRSCTRTASPRHPPLPLTLPACRPTTHYDINLQGEKLYTAIYCYQQDEAFWPKPKDFLPERFLPVSEKRGGLGRVGYRRAAISDQTRSDRIGS